MTKLKDLIKEEPVHKRKLEMRTHALDGDRLIVEGRLKDERFVSGYHWDGKPRKEGIVHRMAVRLLIGGWPPSIMDAEAEMHDIPHELCPTTLDAVKRIIGLSVTPGFSEEIRKRIGGIEGCTHLMQLITAMGPAVLHGYWTQRSRKKHPLPGSLEELPGLNSVINSCRLWREDGPFLKMIKETIGKR
jgi:hypothetical protein